MSDIQFNELMQVLKAGFSLLVLVGALQLWFR